MQLSPLVARMGPMAVLLAALAAVSGCGQTAKVEGTVKYKGEPVAGAMVQLVDDRGTIIATGSTDASGHFTLLTPQSKEAIPHGEYKATVSKSPVGGADSNMMKDAEGKISADAMKSMKNMSRTGNKSILPDKFSNKDMTPFSVKVPNKEPIVLDLGN